MVTQKVAQRKNIWQLIKSISGSPLFPWICFGDFNKVLLSFEKRGGRPRSEWQMRDFWDVVDSCNFQSLRTMGTFFTWLNMRDEEDFIQEKA